MGFALNFFSGNRQEVNSNWYPEIGEPIKSRGKHYSLVLYILKMFVQHSCYRLQSQCLCLDSSYQDVEYGPDFSVLYQTLWRMNIIQKNLYRRTRSIVSHSLVCHTLLCKFLFCGTPLYKAYTQHVWFWVSPSGNKSSRMYCVALSTTNSRVWT